jgi:hypothetical protein
MADNFDLKKFLKESKALENLNPSVKSINENKYYKDAEADDAEHIDALEKDMKDDKKSSMRERIKEYILAELSENDPNYDYEEEDIYGDYEKEPDASYFGVHGLEDEPVDDYYDDGYGLEEAKKKDEEEVEVTDTETEEVPAEEVPAEGAAVDPNAATVPTETTTPAVEVPAAKPAKK